MIRKHSGAVQALYAPHLEASHSQTSFFSAQGVAVKRFEYRTQSVVSSLRCDHESQTPFRAGRTRSPSQSLFYLRRALSGERKAVLGPRMLSQTLNLRVELVCLLMCVVEYGQLRLLLHAQCNFC